MMRRRSSLRREGKEWAPRQVAIRSEKLKGLWRGSRWKRGHWLVTTNTPSGAPLMFRIPCHVAHLDSRMGRLPSQLPTLAPLFKERELAGPPTAAGRVTASAWRLKLSGRG